MSKSKFDIDDDEIRIISAQKPKVQENKHRSFRLYLIIILVVLLLAILLLFVPTHNKTKEEQFANVQEKLLIEQSRIENKDMIVKEKGSIVIVDTIINDKEILILYPENLQPKLVLGSDILNDSAIVLATQAADIRKDNGQIAGTFVMKGELISKGDVKAGFCSIINGEITIGVSDATPMLEQSLTENGYFFRQYPLVVGGQLVENKPKGKAIRKALAEVDGKICVIMSKKRVSFHEFSQLLIDFGVRNAIYLVGSSSYGFYINEYGDKILTGVLPDPQTENTNYIVWKQK